MIDLNICKSCKFFKNYIYFERRASSSPKFCQYCETKALYLESLNQKLNLSKSKKKYEFARYDFSSEMLTGFKFYPSNNGVPKRIPRKPIKFDINGFLDEYECVISHQCPYFIEQEMTMISKTKVK